jgi:ABC-type branched-subunit amino acid transport system substrate-binding protein
LNEDHANDAKYNLWGGSHDQENYQIRIDFPSPLADGGQRWGSPCDLAISHQLLQAQEANIKIGFPVPLMGPYGTEAQDQIRAGQFAVAQFNDAGGRMSASA